jgi:hypothetical protein
MSIAVPYCAVVVADKAVVDALRRVKAGERHGTFASDPQPGTLWTGLCACERPCSLVSTSAPAGNSLGRLVLGLPSRSEYDWGGNVGAGSSLPPSVSPASGSRDLAARAPCMQRTR